MFSLSTWPVRTGGRSAARDFLKDRRASTMETFMGNCRRVGMRSVVLALLAACGPQIDDSSNSGSGSSTGAPTPSTGSSTSIATSVSSMETTSTTPGGSETSVDPDSGSSSSSAESSGTTGGPRICSGVGAWCCSDPFDGSPACQCPRPLTCALQGVDAWVCYECDCDPGDLCVLSPDFEFIECWPGGMPPDPPPATTGDSESSDS